MPVYPLPKDLYFERQDELKRIVTAGFLAFMLFRSSLAIAANSARALGLDSGQSAVYTIGALAAALILFICSLVGF
jgi:tetrahydromethanopterin S-methyltransferase subunit C